MDEKMRRRLWAQIRRLERENKELKNQLASLHERNGEDQTRRSDEGA